MTTVVFTWVHESVKRNELGIMFIEHILDFKSADHVAKTSLHVICRVE